MKVVDEEVGLNHVDRESKNVSDETISKSESSDEEIYLVRAERTEKGGNLRGRRLQLATL